MRVNLILVLVTCLCWPVFADDEALPPVVQIISPDERIEWAEEMYLQARPMAMPRIRSFVPEKSLEETLIELARRPSISSPARGPTVRLPESFKRQLVDPKKLEKRRRRQSRQQLFLASPLGDLVAKNRGTALLDFSSSRLVPEDSRLFYPYDAVGKLFYLDNGAAFECSAAVISARIVLTAGHCVHDGIGSFFSGFQFVPAYHRGEAPAGTWFPTTVFVTGEWSSGGGEVPNTADFGILVMQDSQGSKIGNITGWLGWITNNLVPNHVTMLGYPGNHDKGQRMHQVNSGAWDCCQTNNAIYGSDMRQGSSGGPWVQNFGTKAKRQKGGKNKKMNGVVGVTSAGPGKRPMYLSSSILNQSFVQIWNQACNMAAGNCSR